MKAKVFAFFVLILVFSITSGSLFAHHGNAAFDAGKKVTLKGTVTEWVWANPHCWLKFDVKDDKGGVVRWVAETNNAPDMIERGVTSGEFRPVDVPTLRLAVPEGLPLFLSLSLSSSLFSVHL